jgi:hypothetical protein
MNMVGPDQPVIAFLPDRSSNFLALFLSFSLPQSSITGAPFCPTE